jgi:hypothetical protein
MRLLQRRTRHLRHLLNSPAPATIVDRTQEVEAEREEVEEEREGVAAAADHAGAPERKHVTALTKALGGGEDGSAAATGSATEPATDSPLATGDPSAATLASSEMRESAAHTAGEPDPHRGKGAGGAGGGGVGAGGEGAGSIRIRADRFNHQKIRGLFMLQMLHISSSIGDLF